jgi:sugar-specific transcriptional regulator TrmB
VKFTAWHALAAVAGFLVGQVFRPVPPDVKIWEARVASYQDSVRTFERTVDLLHGSLAKAEDSARTLSSLASSSQAVADREARAKALIKVRADSLLNALGHATTAADSVPVLVVALEARTQQAEAAESEVVSLRQSIVFQQQAFTRLTAALDTSKVISDSLTRRLASADDLLRDRPKNDRCRILWVNCPSRTTTFVVGAVLGVVGGIYVAGR